MLNCISIGEASYHFINILFQYDTTSNYLQKYRRRYKELRCEKEKNNSASSDSSEEGKTPIVSPCSATNILHNAAGLTNGDILNRNLNKKTTDNELNYSSLDTIKDYNFITKSFDDTRFKVDEELDDIVLVDSAIVGMYT